MWLKMGYHLVEGDHDEDINKEEGKISKLQKDVQNILRNN